MIEGQHTAGGEDKPGGVGFDAASLVQRATHFLWGERSPTKPRQDEPRSPARPRRNMPRPSRRGWGRGGADVWLSPSWRAYKQAIRAHQRADTCTVPTINSRELTERSTGLSPAESEGLPLPIHLKTMTRSRQNMGCYPLPVTSTKLHRDHPPSLYWSSMYTSTLLSQGTRLHDGVV